MKKKDWFGIGLEPSSKTIVGSQEVPYIYEDRLNKEQFLEALRKMYNMSPEERKKLGDKGRQHVINNYNFVDFWFKDIYNALVFIKSKININQ